MTTLTELIQYIKDEVELNDDAEFRGANFIVNHITKRLIDLGLDLKLEVKTVYQVKK